MPCWSKATAGNCTPDISSRYILGCVTFARAARCGGSGECTILKVGSHTERQLTARSRGPRAATVPVVCRSGRSHEHLTSEDARPGRRRRRRQGAGTAPPAPSRLEQRAARQRARWGRGGQALGQVARHHRAGRLPAGGHRVLRRLRARSTTPKPNDLANAQASIIYYADGKTEIDRISEVNRESVQLSQVPEARAARRTSPPRTATSTSNSGISPTGIARAVWVDAARRRDPGRLDDHPAVRQELLPHPGPDAVPQGQGDRHLDQDRQAEVQGPDPARTTSTPSTTAAAPTASRPRRKAYFGKDVSKLNAAEGALLASVIRGPSFYDPGLGTAAGAERRGPLDLRHGRHGQQGLDHRRRSAPRRTFPKVVKYEPRKGAADRTASSPTPVKDELKGKLKLTDADIDRGGYKIVTTIDKKAQDAAVAAIKDRMPTGKGTTTLRVGLTAIKPGDGAVVAMYGGKDYRQGAVQHRDAGHHAGRVDLQGRSPSSPRCRRASAPRRSSPGTAPQYFPEFKEQGATDFPPARCATSANEQFGNIDLRTATGHSVNTVYAPAQHQGRPGQDQGRPRSPPGCPTKGLNTNYANVFGTATTSRSSTWPTPTRRSPPRASG